MERKEKNVIVQASDLQLILDYLIKQPYSEVYMLVDIIMRAAKEPDNG